MKDRNSKHFSNFVTGQDLASIPHKLRQQYTADKQQRLLNNLDDSQYATLQLDSKILIYPQNDADPAQEEITLRRFILRFGENMSKFCDYGGHDMNFVLSKTNDILNFNNYVQAVINAQGEATLEKYYHSDECCKDLYENETKYIEAYANRDEDGLSRIQFHDFIELCYQCFSKNKYGLPFDGVIRLEKQNVPSNKVKYLGKKNATEIESTS